MSKIKAKEITWERAGKYWFYRVKNVLLCSIELRWGYAYLATVGYGKMVQLNSLEEAKKHCQSELNSLIQSIAELGE